MPGSFHIVRDSPDDLILDLGSHSLDGDAVELWDFVSAEIASGRHALITLRANDAATVSLEGVGVLVRLLGMATEADSGLDVVSLHPALERKLQLTGLLAMFRDDER
jgi:anti-anti-sigma regulatory factor